MHKLVNNNAYRNAFAIGIGLNIAFVAVEVVFGLKAGSTSLLADAGHNLSDVVSLAFAWVASWLASLKPGGRYTFGFRKTTILVSILNALLLFGAVIAIGWEAIGRLKEPVEVSGGTVMLVAGIGIVINSITALLFMKSQHSDLNIRGAFLHMLADAAVSAGVVVSGLLIVLTGKEWIDPVISFGIIIVIILGTWRLFIKSVDLALDAVPGHINLDSVRDYILGLQGVMEVHDLHIWAMSTTQVALTVHLVMPGEQGDDFISELQEGLKDKFGINHTTIQVEKEKIEGEYSDECC
jgi:cobalt-zinc-cadmium efflux system protein